MDFDCGDIVLILDAGSQYCKLIDRMVRSLCIKTIIKGINISHEEILSAKYKAIIISGGPMSVNNEDENPRNFFDGTIFDLGIPILAICYGMQLLVKYYGGKVIKSSAIEVSQTPIIIKNTCAVYEGMDPNQVVLMTHSDNCIDISDFFTVNATTSAGVIASISDDTRRIYGVQFHPEVNLTTNGNKIFENFLFNISHCKAEYTQECKIEMCKKIVKSVNPESLIVCLVSGGVDSTVCAVLINQYLNNNKLFLMINNGFLRENEPESVVKNMAGLGINVNIVESGPMFMNGTTYAESINAKYAFEIGPLKLICGPEHKRQIIGDMFIVAVTHALNKLGYDINNSVLVQGTLRPDLIESGSHAVSSHAYVIKTHHNDSPKVRELRKHGKVLEPLIDFHKDEVRAIAGILKIPKYFMERRPFPGPGLAIRIICTDKPVISGHDDKYDTPILACIVANFYQRLQSSGVPVYKLIKESLSPIEYAQLLEATNVPYQYLSTLVPILSVGVQGDCRSYKNCIALSSNCECVDWGKLYTIAKIIPKICTNINRIVYAFGPAIVYPVTSATLTLLSPESIEMSRAAHAIVDKHISNERICFCDIDLETVSQFPVVLIPIHFDIDSSCNISPMRRSLVLRPFISKDFMTGVPAIPSQDIDLGLVNRIKDELLQMPSISRVLYDLTCKPPGTTEWE